jgi:hypothetical protein
MFLKFSHSEARAILSNLSSFPCLAYLCLLQLEELNAGGRFLVGANTLAKLKEQSSGSCGVLLRGRDGLLAARSRPVLRNLFWRVSREFSWSPRICKNNIN